jgi:hypothetical protein
MADITELQDVAKNNLSIPAKEILASLDGYKRIPRKAKKTGKRSRLKPLLILKGPEIMKQYFGLQTQPV